MPSEMIDVLDKNGANTGRVKTRDEIHRQGLWHKIAVVVILDEQNRILLQQRSGSKPTNPGKWDVAVAGHVNAGEDTATTARREAAEEIGILADKLEFILNYRQESEHEWHNERLIDKQYFDCFMLRVPVVDLDALNLQSSEVQAVRVCTLEEFKNMIDSGVMVNRRPLYERLIELMEHAR